MTWCAMSRAGRGRATTPTRSPNSRSTLLACLRGSICLYQGEELGLTEAEIAFEDLRDPYGIRFWPGFKGRDGCRTPMAWEADAANAGFSTGKPWLPIPEDHRIRAADVQARDPASVLSRYRAMLALRKRHPSLVRGSIKFLDGADDVLAFVREGSSERLLCVFNFAEEERRWPLPGGVLVFDEIELPGQECAAGRRGDQAVSRWAAMWGASCSGQVRIARLPVGSPSDWCQLLLCVTLTSVEIATAPDRFGARTAAKNRRLALAFGGSVRIARVI